MHEDEIDVDEALVRRLLATLSPAYAELPLRRFHSTGSSNALFRLGDDLLVRVPRQPGATATLEKEQRWLPFVAPELPVAVPEVLAVGDPIPDYPQRWSVVRFLEGSPPPLPAADEPPRHRLARDLAAVVRGLRSLPVPDDARADPALRWSRGEPIADLDDDVRRWLAQCRAMPQLELDLAAAERVWRDALSLSAAHETGPPRWHHADLLAENLLGSADGLTAVLDFGALSIGNPEVDLAVAWELLDPIARTTFRDAVGVSDEEWRLGRAWALVLALMTLPYYWHTMPGRCASRLAQARAVLAETA
jgi:aminoglycoside phosphotransferase (APT) family kinase protein